jgi:hypothetical protein
MVLDDLIYRTKNIGQLMLFFYRYILISRLQMKLFIRRKPVFIFLLPFFFVFHGFIEHFNFVRAFPAFLLMLLYTFGSLIITGIFWIFYRNFIKAALLSVYIMIFFFFFGNLQDFLRNHFGSSFVSRYSFILPIIFFLFILFVIWLKKRQASLQGFISYLNILLVLLTVIDLFWLGEKIILKKKLEFNFAAESMIPCDTCKKPDIFFIILDEYAGNTELKELFNFNNNAFERQLEQHGFYIAKESRSNYNFTPFSVASILNMNYLNLNMKEKAPGNIDYCYKQIKNSSVINFLLTKGYEFYNYSVFDFEGRPAIKYDNFLPTSTSLISSQTFLSRVMKDMRFNIGSGKWKFKAGLKKITYEHLHNNENILQVTKAIASEKNGKPKFVYSHLMMPHYPYYFNKKGDAQPIEKLFEGQEINKENYIEYLQYCNGQILQLVDHIITASDKPPVIMLLSDHGFRHISKKEERAYVFMNLNAIFLPDKNYSLFYDSISNVNHFRIFFNTEFQQRLPLLKDSTIFLWGN